ncbi:MAG: hypothetical protein Q9218_001832 [Villophora microphyllina]
MPDCDADEKAGQDQADEGDAHNQNATLPNDDMEDDREVTPNEIRYLRHLFLFAYQSLRDVSRNGDPDYDNYPSSRHHKF